MMRKRGTRSNALLIEIVLVVLFFMLSCTVILRLFAAVHDCCRDAATLETACIEAKNCAERLYAAQDAASLLEEEGFAPIDGAYARGLSDRLTVFVMLSESRTEAGALREARVEVRDAQETVFALPVARYLPDGEAHAQ